MSRISKSFFVTLFSIVLILACISTTVFALDTLNVQVILSENNGENPVVYYFKLDKNTNYTLLELMQRKFLVEDDNGYITSIQGKEATASDRTAWMYDINGEMALVGAGDYRIKDGDVYHWDLRKW